MFWRKKEIVTETEIWTVTERQSQNEKRISLLSFCLMASPNTLLNLAAKRMQGLDYQFLQQG